MTFLKSSKLNKPLLLPLSFCPVGHSAQFKLHMLPGQNVSATGNVITFEFLKIFHWILAKIRLKNFFQVEFSVKMRFLIFINDTHMNYDRRSIYFDCKKKIPSFLALN